MPFTPVTALPENPLAKLYFTGQLIIEPSADGATCEVFVNRSATNHELLIEIRLTRPVGPDIILMRHQGRLNHASAQHGMTILIESGATGVKRYDGPDQPGAHKLGRAVDMRDLYQTHAPPAPDLSVDPQLARPSILLNDGVFYAAERTAEVFELKLAGSPLPDLTDFASIVGVDIPRAGSSPLVVTWRAHGNVEQIGLKPRTEPGFGYEIYVINDPPFELMPIAGVPPHDEFKEYFKALFKVPPAKHLSLTPKASAPPSGGAQRGSTRTPCMPIILGP